MNVQGRRFVSHRVMEYFSRAMAAGRLAHAYLLSGPKGAGKQAAALEAAQMVNCLSPQGFVPGCPCPSCHKILSGIDTISYVSLHCCDPIRDPSITITVYINSI